MKSSDTRAMQVLIIEDDAIVAQDIALSVEAGGGKVVAYAETAREALEAAQHVGIDLVLSDVRLADGSDGIDASARIQAQFHVPVAFVTAAADAVRMARMRRLDPLAILHKPVCETDILMVLD